MYGQKVTSFNFKIVLHITNLNKKMYSLVSNLQNIQLSEEKLKKLL